MNTATQSDTTFVNTIARHLNTELQGNTPRPHAALRAHSLPAQTVAHTNEAAQTAEAAGCADTSVVLYNLLMQYVDLLEAPDHGGWTLQEDNAVRDAVNMLARQGWKVRLPHGMA